MSFQGVRPGAVWNQSAGGEELDSEYSAFLDDMGGGAPKVGSSFIPPVARGRDGYLFRQWNILRMPIWLHVVFSAYRYCNIPVFYAFYV